MRGNWDRGACEQGEKTNLRVNRSTGSLRRMAGEDMHLFRLRRQADDRDKLTWATYKG